MSKKNNKLPQPQDLEKKDSPDLSSNLLKQILEELKLLKENTSSLAKDINAQKHTHAMHDRRA